MIFSMTAFSRQQLEKEWGSLTWEIRSVNHRYLEPTIRLPEPLRGLELKVRDILRKRLSRGKIECQLRYQANQTQQARLNLNEELVKQLHIANRSIHTLDKDMPLPSTIDLLRWPGVICEQETDVDTLEQQALTLFNAALDELIEARSREGQELGKFVQKRLESINKIVAEIRELMPEILARQKQQILDRLEELKLELEPSRLEQELVLLAQKSDVDEELDRLESHVTEVTRVLSVEGPKGRRLDFLMQELNREANTLSSNLPLRKLPDLPLN